MSLIDKLPFVSLRTAVVPARGKKIVRRIKYEHELDLEFGERIAAEAYGQKLLSCIQCGTCSATCPVSHFMDFTPRRIIAMVREGFKDDALNSATIWLCASCYSCTVQCPRNIHITDVMYTLKREAIAQGIYPRRFPIPVLARLFFSSVRKNGRSTESWLLVKLFLRTNPMNMFKQAWLGARLWLAGRMSLRRERIKDVDQLHTLMEAVERSEGGATP